MLSILKIETDHNISISHTKNCSAVCISTKYKIGIDIENSNRKLTQRLEDRLISNNEIQKDPIEIWTMMESAFKCLDGKGIHFLNYTFLEYGDGFILNNSKKTVHVISNIYCNYSVSVSFSDQY